jgi:hypothetical protein
MIDSFHFECLPHMLSVVEDVELVVLRRRGNKIPSDQRHTYIVNKPVREMCKPEQKFRMQPRAANAALSITAHKRPHKAREWQSFHQVVNFNALSFAQ